MIVFRGKAIVAILLSISISQDSTCAAEDNDQSARTGSFSLLATPTEIVGPDSAANFAAVIPVDEAINWQITVPEFYDPDKSPGLLVYISPSNSGKMPRSWLSLPESHNFIWIGADQSGNRIAVARRVTMALFAVGLVNKRYSIDSRRIYLSGFSGGARVAGLVAAAYPQIFKGDIYIGGAETWEDELTPDKLEAMKQNRYVFIVGSDDFNRRMAREVAEKYTAAGIENIELKIIAHMGHELPRSRDMYDALNYLDAAVEP